MTIVEQDINKPPKNKVNETILLLCVFCVLFTINLLYRPITTLECNKNTNTCQITQNFFTNYNFALFETNNDKLVLYPVQYVIRGWYVYGIKVNLPYYQYKYILYDNSYRAFRQLNNDFYNFVNDKYQYTYKKVYIPFNNLALLLFLIVYIFIPQKYKRLYLGGMFIYPFLDLCINQIISIIHYY